MDFGISRANSSHDEDAKRPATAEHLRGLDRQRLEDQQTQPWSGEERAGTVVMDAAIPGGGNIGGGIKESKKKGLEEQLEQMRKVKQKWSQGWWWWW